VQPAHGGSLVLGLQRGSLGVHGNVEAGDGDAVAVHEHKRDRIAGREDQQRQAQGQEERGEAGDAPGAQFAYQERDERKRTCPANAARQQEDTDPHGRDVQSYRDRR
jgi:hypothetical protein